MVQAKPHIIPMARQGTRYWVCTGLLMVPGRRSAIVQRVGSRPDLALQRWQTAIRLLQIAGGADVRG